MSHAERRADLGQVLTELHRYHWCGGDNPWAHHAYRQEDVASVRKVLASCAVGDVDDLTGLLRWPTIIRDVAGPAGLLDVDPFSGDHRGVNLARMVELAAARVEGPVEKSVCSGEMTRAEARQELRRFSLGKRKSQ